jgi:hypothetical protein
MPGMACVGELWFMIEIGFFWRVAASFNKLIKADKKKLEQL